VPRRETRRHNSGPVPLESRGTDRFPERAPGHARTRSVPTPKGIGMATVEDEQEHRARQAPPNELELDEFAETADDGGITAAQMNGVIVCLLPIDTVAF
jgi:hypothetical protein